MEPCRDRTSFPRGSAGTCGTDSAGASQGAAVEPIAAKIDCQPQILHDWVRNHEIDSGLREGVTSKERERIKVLEQELKEPRRANEILKPASVPCPQKEMSRPRYTRSSYRYF